MDGKPPIEKATSLYLFSGEECNSNFFLEKRTKKKTFFKNVACMAKESNLTQFLMGSPKDAYAENTIVFSHHYKFQVVLIFNYIPQKKSIHASNYYF
jgi:hypothetical protein